MTLTFRRGRDEFLGAVTLAAMGLDDDGAHVAEQFFHFAAIAEGQLECRDQGLWHIQASAAALLRDR